MEMTNYEIFSRWKRSDAPSKQINILADLNDCSPTSIRDIIKNELKKRGEAMPEPKKRGPYKKKTEPEEKPAAEKKTKEEDPKIAVPPVIREAILEKLAKNREEYQELLDFLKKIDEKPED